MRKFDLVLQMNQEIFFICVQINSFTLADQTGGGGAAYMLIGQTVAKPLSQLVCLEKGPCRKSDGRRGKIHILVYP